MADRAQYLARLLVSRLQNLERILVEDVPDETEQRKRREELVAKILAVEMGVTEGRQVLRVTGALPRVLPDEPVPEREVRELADLLRAHDELGR
jgi:hypothetical protein